MKVAYILTKACLKKLENHHPVMTERERERGIRTDRERDDQTEPYCKFLPDDLQFFCCLNQISTGLEETHPLCLYLTEHLYTRTKSNRLNVILIQ